jgi:hypothetical protein
MKFMEIVTFWHPVEGGIFKEVISIPRNSEQLNGIFFVDIDIEKRQRGRDGRKMIKGRQRENRLEKE